MEKIAFISGETIYYWSSIVLTLATLTAICFFWSLYLGKGGNGVAAFSVVPLAIVLSLLLGRLVHWYCRTSSYDSFEAAMKPFSPGGYALLGVFAGCALAAVIVRLVHFDQPPADAGLHGRGRVRRYRRRAARLLLQFR